LKNFLEELLKLETHTTNSQILNKHKLKHFQNVFGFSKKIKEQKTIIFTSQAFVPNQGNNLQAAKQKNEKKTLQQQDNFRNKIILNQVFNLIFSSKFCEK
jgi:hypothetical protein